MKRKLPYTHLNLHTSVVVKSELKRRAKRAGLSLSAYCDELFKAAIKRGK